MGCEITGDSQKCGTIGPFFEEHGHVYFLTSSHVLFDMSMIPEDQTEYEWNATEQNRGSTTNVYQPGFKNLRIWSREDEPVGKVVCAFYKTGDDSTPGMEVAVVKITDPKRKPISCNFPDPMEEPMETAEVEVPTAPISYETGEVIEKDFITNNCCIKVLKFGAESGMTESRVMNIRSSVRGEMFLGGKTLLLNQIEIVANYEGNDFAKEGDSGSLVLALVNENLKALGLLVGKASTGRILATPVYAILDELKLSQRRFKAFHRHPITQVSTDSGINPVSPTDTFDSINQAISQKVSEHINENTTKLSAQMSPRFVSIETDVTDLKTKVSGIETKLSNVDSNVSEIETRLSSVESKVSGIETKLSSVDSNVLNIISILKNQGKP